MTKIYGLCALLALCVGKAASHSWINNPPQRFPASSDYCLKNDDGTLFRDKNNNLVCGEDAKAIDLFIMRPNSFAQNPCYFSGDTTFANVPTRSVETDSTMCLTWAANSHDTDGGRNADGGVRISLSTNVARPSQADFDKMILANNIPFEKFPGAKVKIPALPTGQYVLQFYWSWPFGTDGRRLFVSCSNLTILEKGSARVASENSKQFPGLGLPNTFTSAPSNWWCNAGDGVYANSSLTGLAASVAAPLPAAPSATVAPSPTVASTSAASTNQASASSNQGTASSNQGASSPTVASTNTAASNSAPTVKAATAAPPTAAPPAPCNCAVTAESDDDAMPTIAAPAALTRATVAPTPTASSVTDDSVPAASAARTRATPTPTPTSRSVGAGASRVSARNEPKVRNEPKPQPNHQASPQRVVEFEYSFQTVSSTAVSMSQISVLSGVLCVFSAIVAFL